MAAQPQDLLAVAQAKAYQGKSVFGSFGTAL
jgi:hypothetical protein